MVSDLSFCSSWGLERVEVQHVLCPGGGGTLASTGVVVQEGMLEAKGHRGGRARGGVMGVRRSGSPV